MTDFLTIVTTIDVTDDARARLRALDPRIRVIDAAAPVAEYFRVKRQDSAGLAAATEAIRPLLAEADVIWGLVFDTSILALAPRLKWLQVISAGVDHLPGADLDARGVLVSCSRIHAIQIGEYVTAMLFALTKNLPGLIRAQDKRTRWRPELAELYGQTLGIVGVGVIGGRVAEIARVLGLRVIGCRRTPPPAGGDGQVDEWYPLDRLHDLLAASDHVLLAVPGTAATRNLIGAAELAAMKRSAYLINIARGSVVDEPALIAALRDGTIAGAALDVFVREPLPDDSPLWDLPNVILTPHLAGRTAHYNARALDLFVDNLTHFLAAGVPRRVVDWKLGY